MIKGNICRILIVFVAIMGVYVAYAKIGVNPRSAKYLPVSNTSSRSFCGTFKMATMHGCRARVRYVPFLGAFVCSDMKTIHRGMLRHYDGDVRRACKLENPENSERCIDGWHCYMNGGKNRSGRPCSGTGHPCI